ncbi:sulfotransferase family protein [Oceanicola sp. S124]|uniref:sulfotransferase family protein n=1 Tax=Oceanicola sp. S124 TaxID=1042378 RepID=UPI000255850A|nr:sulfotransferase family protein [Oceanicola sp. S124]
MPQTDLIFLLGRHRSGTTVFRDLLERCGGLNCHEIMSAKLEAERGFYGYVARRVAEDPKWVWPIRHQRLFADYIEELRGLARGRHLLLDLKYWGLNLIPVSEDVTGARPFLVDFIDTRDSPVIQIVRRNKLRLITSEALLNASGKWFAAAGEGPDVGEKPKVSLPVASLPAEIERLIGLDTAIRAMLAPLSNAHELTYEEMFSGTGDFAERTRTLAGKVMGCDAVPLAPSHRKMNPEPLSQILGNYAEVAAALEGGPHEWMLASPL